MEERYDIRIDSEFRSFMDPLTTEERRQLEANLLADGCRDLLVVWDEPPPETGYCKECYKDVRLDSGDCVWRCEICGFGVAPVENGPVLLDGHNRYEICELHDIPYETVEIELDSREAAINWIIDNQAGRRNVTPERMSYFRGKKYNLEKTDSRANLKQNSPNPQNEGSVNTAERLASQYKVSRATIERDGAFAASALGRVCQPTRLVVLVWGKVHAVLLV